MIVRPARRAAAAAVVVVLVASTVALAAQPTPSPTFSAPVRVGFPNGDDWEPAIAADARGHVYIITTHYVGFGGSSSGDPDPTCPTCVSPHMILQVSSDGGATFSAPRALIPASTTRQDDPQVVVDPADGRTVYAAFMQDDKSSQYVARSNDFGRTWRPVLTERLQRGTDKDILAVRGSDVYLAYHTQQKIFISVSHDRGETWSLQNPLGTTNSQFGVSLASGGAVAPDGTVYFALNGVNRPGQAKGTINLYVVKSTDRGQTWTTSQVDVSQAPADCGCGGWDYWGAQMALAVDANNTAYVLWNANAVKGTPHRMYFARSTDDGATWSPRVDVSLAPSGSNNVFPAVAARGNGDVRIAWQDDRNGFDPGDDSPDARWNTYYRSSADGGAMWSGETKLSAHVPGYTYKLLTPADGYLQPYGDYFEIDITGIGRTVAVWGEGKSYFGPGNIWYAHGP
jgi:BNR repeat protein